MRVGRRIVVPRAKLAEDRKNVIAVLDNYFHQSLAALLGDPAVDEIALEIVVAENDGDVALTLT